MVTRTYCQFVTLDIWYNTYSTQNPGKYILCDGKEAVLTNRLDQVPPAALCLCGSGECTGLDPIVDARRREIGGSEPCCRLQDEFAVTVGCPRRIAEIARQEDCMMATSASRIVRPFWVLLLVGLNACSTVVGSGPAVASPSENRLLAVISWRDSRLSGLSRFPSRLLEAARRIVFSCCHRMA